jgi:hypothetical protein
MLNNLTNFFNLIRGRKIKTSATLADTDLIPMGTKDTNFLGGYQPTAVQFDELKANIIASVPPPPPSGVESVTADGSNVVLVDNTDPLNPVVGFNGVYTDNTTLGGNGTSGTPLFALYQAPAVDGTTVTGDGTGGNPLVASFQSPAVDGVTITGDGTPGNPLVAVSSGGGAVNYGHVFFVDATNGNDSTAAAGNFTKPYLWIYNAMNAAAAASPTSTNRALVYVRAGYYADLGGSNIMALRNYVDIYMEPGVVLDNGTIDDYSNGVECKIFGKAVFSNMVYANSAFRSTGPSNIYFEFDSMRCIGAAIEIGSSANVTIDGRYIYSQTLGKGFGLTLRSSGTMILNISESINAWHQTILFKYFGGKCVINCPKITIQTGSYYGNNYKQVVQCADFNSGGECTINGNLVNEDTYGYWGGISGMIGRWTGTDNMTLRLNGKITAGDYWAYYALANTSLSKTIINGDITTNHLIGYASNSSQVIVRNAHLINTKSYSAATAYPVVSMGGSSVVYFENCTAYGFGAVTGFTNKDTAGCTLVVTNMMYSNADGLGYFVVNTASGTPVNNVRLNNVRSKVPNDTNITDLLSPTGFIADANTLTPNFI